MQVEEHYLPVPAGRVFTRQWGSGPALVFAHATGMCARMYQDFLMPLGERYRVITYDARGHGRTELLADPADVPYDYVIFQQDLADLIAALGGADPVYLAGHSFGGSVVFETAVRNPGLARHVLLIDPPFIPFHVVGEYRMLRTNPHMPHLMADQAERRRSHYPSLAAMRASYRGRGVFQDWPDAVLDAYLEGAVLPDENGVHLACDPKWEASSFRGVTTTMGDSFRAAKHVSFTLLAADIGSTVNRDDEQTLRRAFPDATIKRFEGTGHFLPVTHPDLVRPYLEAMQNI